MIGLKDLSPSFQPKRSTKQKAIALCVRDFSRYEQLTGIKRILIGSFTVHSCSDWSGYRNYSIMVTVLDFRQSFENDSKSK